MQIEELFIGQTIKFDGEKYTVRLIGKDFIKVNRYTYQNPYYTFDKATIDKSIPVIEESKYII